MFSAKHKVPRVGLHICYGTVLFYAHLCGEVDQFIKPSFLFPEQCDLDNPI